jgi:hypothetical protein
MSNKVRSVVLCSLMELVYTGRVAKLVDDEPQSAIKDVVYQR